MTPAEKGCDVCLFFVEFWAIVNNGSHIRLSVTRRPTVTDSRPTVNFGNYSSLLPSFEDFSLIDLSFTGI